MQSKKKKKSKAGPLIFLLLFLAAAGIFGLNAYRRYGPVSERMSEEELFGMSGSRTAIMYDYALQSAEALFSDGEVYLPLNWVNSILNSRFYWDETESRLVYALPDSVVTATEDTTGSSGKKLFVFADGKVYLSQALIKTYTDVRMDVFADGDVKRIFVTDTWDPVSTAAAQKKTMLRSRPSIRGKVIAEIGVNETLTFIPDHDQKTDEADPKWQRVVTETGLTGYVQLKKLSAPETKEYAHTYTAPVYTNISHDGAVILGWHQVTNQDSNKSLKDVVANAAGLNVVSPTWFSLKDNAGNYDSLASSDYVKTAHDKGLQVWALLDNFSDQVTLGTVLKSTAVRTKLIESLMNDADEYGFDGINIDFERVRQDAAKQYLEFIRELSVACRKKKLVLSVDTPNPASYNQFYDRKEIGTVADYVINMGYDEHTAGDDLGMGSTSSISFVKNGIADCLKEVPQEKLINGIPFYTRVWTSSSGKITSEALGMKEAKEWTEKNGVKLKWDDELGQYYGETVSSKDKSTKYIWLEEEKSLGLKMSAIRDAKLAGVACWKLGLEPEEIWSVVDEIKNK